MALAVRIARGMGLHHEAVTRTPFDTEIRRRLWHQIRFLDVFSSWDRSSELLIDKGSYDTPRPRDVNDDEFDEDSKGIHDHEAGLTDMSFGKSDTWFHCLLIDRRCADCYSLPLQLYLPMKPLTIHVT